MTHDRVDETFNDEERAALELVAKILAEIRFTCSGTVEEITATDLRIMHDLADAAHNIPRLLARKRTARESLSFPITTELKRANDTYAGIVPQTYSQVTQLRLYDDDDY